MPFREEISVAARQLSPAINFVPKQLLSGWHRLRALQVKLYLTLLGVEFGTGMNAQSLPFCRRHKGARVVIGKHLTMNNCSAENPAGINHPCILVAGEPGAKLLIGDHVGLSGATIFCSRRIEIQDYVLIGVNAKILDTDFHPVDWRERREPGSRRTGRAPVLIKHDAWIGANALILKGVTIGCRSIVAAGAVVTHDVPDDVMVAGVPARVVAAL